MDADVWLSLPLVFFLEQRDALLCLPLLIFQLACVEIEKALIKQDGGFFVAQTVIGRGEQKIDGRGVGHEFCTLPQRLNGELRLVKFRCGKGDSGPGVGVVGIDGGGLLKGVQRFSKMPETHEVLAVTGEQIGVFRVRAQQREIERVGIGEVAGIGLDARQHASDLFVIGLQSVKLLEQGNSFAFVFGDKDGSQLRGEGNVTGIFLDSRTQKRLGFWIFFFCDEQVGQSADGWSGVGVAGKQAMIGGLRVCGVSAGLGKAGGKERVLACLGRDFEGLNQIVGSLDVIGFAIDSDAINLCQRAPGLGQCGFAFEARIKLRGGDESRARLGELAGASQQQPKRNLRGKILWLQGDTAAIKRDGVGVAILFVGDVGGIEKSARIGGMTGQPGVEQGRSGLPVLFGERGFGTVKLGGTRIGRSLRGWHVDGRLARGSLGGGSGLSSKRNGAAWAEQDKRQGTHGIQSLHAYQCTWWQGVRWRSRRQEVDGGSAEPAK